MAPAATCLHGTTGHMHLIAYFLRQTAVAKDFLCLVERRRSNEFLFLPEIKANHLTTLLDSFGTLFFLTYDSGKKGGDKQRQKAQNTSPFSKSQ